jgi:hypothetical protein
MAKTFRMTTLFCVVYCLLGHSSGYAGILSGPKLFVSPDGVALSSFPHRQNLSRSIRVDRTQGTAQMSWVATSNRYWLTVTNGGLTGGTLTVTANPYGLKPDREYVADVTVSTIGGDFTDTETLRVGFWVGSADPATVTHYQSATSIAANPVTPVAYVTDGGSSILEYNVYSGALIGTLQNVASTIGQMEVSSDGKTLFVADTTNNNILALNAETGAQLRSYSLSAGYNMVYARPYGQPALFISGGPIMAYPSGEILANNLFGGLIAVNANGQKLFGVDAGVSPGTLYNYFVGLNKGKLVVNPITSARLNASNCEDLASSRDGSRVYPACGSPYEFDAYDGTTLAFVQTLPANAYPNNAEVDAKDRFIGRINGIYAPNDVFVFSHEGFSRGVVPSLPVSSEQGFGQLATLMKVSGDTTRVISIIDGPSEQTLAFRNLP